MARPIEFDSVSQETMAFNPAIMDSAMPSTFRSDSMSVDEYFDKVRKAVEKRYENL